MGDEKEEHENDFEENSPPEKKWGNLTLNKDGEKSSAEKEKVLLYDAIDASILKTIPNPSKEPYEIKVKVPEFTFLGVNEQPDFGVLYVTIYPTKKIIELKSLKQYTYQLRNIVVSYERLINVVYDQLMEVYKPDRLRLVLKSNPRGGISSRLVIDSDWSVRGGDEKYRDWGQTDDSWEVSM